MLSLAARSSRCLRSVSCHTASFSLSAVAHAKKPTPTEHKDKWNYTTEVSWDETPDPQHLQYDLVTSNDLQTRKEPPRRVKMLVRDFIEDSLYNPHYGYFPTKATIVDSPETIDFSKLRDSSEFDTQMAKLYYGPYGKDAETGIGTQVWHTPTEAFKPWYGQAVAKCLVSEYYLKYFPYEDFIIYEIGAGNGTLAMDIMNFLRDEHPEVYDRTRYNIIEISGSLAKIQKEKLYSVHPGVKVVHKSIFHWNVREPAPCFFIAMEVIDNFAHDVIRYDIRSLEPYQGVVAIDENGDFHPFYTRITDPLISTFLELQRALKHHPPISKILSMSQTLRDIYTSFPLAPNLTGPEYIPTRLLSLLQTLRNHFPRHRLLLTDFSSLPEPIPGINAPRVQVRIRNTTVPVSTVFVKHGYFDIFFPTNFERLRDMYEHILSQPLTAKADMALPERNTPLTSNTSSLSLGSQFFSSHHPKNRRVPLDGVTSASGLNVGVRKSSVFTQAEFLKAYGNLEKTRLKSGENPLLDSYQNVKFLF